jgi:hypothetical protein
MIASEKRLDALMHNELREMAREGSLPRNGETACAQALANVVLDCVRPDVNNASCTTSIADGNLMLAAFFIAETGHVKLAADNPEAARLMWQAAKTAMRIAISAGMLNDTGRTYRHGERPGVSGVFITTMT